MLDRSAARRRRRRKRRRNLEDFMSREKISKAVNDRISAYEKQQRAEATELRQWEIAHFNQLVERLANPDHLAVLSWEDLIKCVRDKDPEAGAQLGDFYDRCHTFA
jgi:hypothetical protein